MNKVNNIGKTNYDRYDPIIYDKQQAELKMHLLEEKNRGDVDKMNKVIDAKF